MTAVSDLLTASMAIHRRAASSRTGRPTNWKELLTEAAGKRREALALDPSQVDPAWAEESRHTAVGRNTHAVMTAFYESLGI